jgi:hypothetical protein
MAKEENPKGAPQPERPEALRDLTVSFEYVPPGIAANWLNESPQFNRGIGERVVGRYATDMVEDRWFVTGESVIFNGKKIEDGWHRLSAIVQSGKGQWLVIVRGVPENAFHYIDHGKARLFKDTLEVLTVDHASTVSSAVSYITGYELSKRFTNSALLEHQRWDTYQRHGEAIKELVEARYKKNPPIAVPKGLLAAVHFVLGQIDEGPADEFMETVLIGDDLEADHPVAQFRAIVKKIMVMDQKPTGLPTRYGAGLLKAWNLVRRNERVARWTTLPNSTPAPV